MKRVLLLMMLMLTVMVVGKEKEHPHKVTAVVVKDGKAKGYGGNIFVRYYGTNGAVNCTVQGSAVIVTYKDGKISVYRLKDGVRIRSY